jgi:holo-[acyl-carrier protein] synthase
LRSPHAREAALTLRCGVDLVSVSRLLESLDGHGERFVARLFTAAERHDVDTLSDTTALRAQRLAARFAAKEACIKALGLVDVGLDWRDIEVRRHDDGRCTLALHGVAAARAAALGVTSLALSLSHEDDHAVALVQALVRTPVSRQDRYPFPEMDHDCCADPR